MGESSLGTEIAICINSATVLNTNALPCCSIRLAQKSGSAEPHGTSETRGTGQVLKTPDLPFENELIQKKLDEGCDIHPFPRSANRLITALNDPDSDSEALAQNIESDAGLAVRMLRMANSPMFGVKQELTSIRQAVTLLGRRRPKNLAFTYA